MKKRYYILLIIFSLILVVSLSMSIYISRTLDQLMDDNLSNISKKIEPRYHFSAIIHKTDESYWKGIEKGLIDSSAKANIALELMYTSSDNEYEQTLTYFDMAITSNVEGILIHGYDTPEFSQLVDKAFARGIPVVTIDSDCPKSKIVSFVGTSDFELGGQWAKQVLSSVDDRANVAIIINNSSNQNNDGGKNIVSGFKDSIKYNANISVDTVKSSDLGILGAKNILQDIITNNKEVNTIVCTSASDTIGIAQQIVDYNKVGDFVIIGYDNSDEILKYIQKGVVFSTLIPDPVKIGEKSIENLTKVKETGWTYAYTLTDIDIVNKENIDDYMNSRLTERSIESK